MADFHNQVPKRVVPYLIVNSQYRIHEFLLPSFSVYVQFILHQYVRPVSWWFSETVSPLCFNVYISIWKKVLHCNKLGWKYVQVTFPKSLRKLILSHFEPETVSKRMKQSAELNLMVASEEALKPQKHMEYQVECEGQWFRKVKRRDVGKTFSPVFLAFFIFYYSVNYLFPSEMGRVLCALSLTIFILQRLGW